ncbi:MAG: hypothetical protein ACRENT_10470, partial [Thermodesulfobacteriota bacterium]
MPQTLSFAGRRFLTHFVLAIFTGAGCYFAFLLKPDRSFVQLLTLGLGYVSFILILITLMIGPWTVLS